MGVIIVIIIKIIILPASSIYPIIQIIVRNTLLLVSCLQLCLLEPFLDQPDEIVDGEIFLNG